MNSAGDRYVCRKMINIKNQRKIIDFITINNM